DYYCQSYDSTIWVF
nr:immunoglobulin light chain junction region [Macaca mulatta]